MSSLLTPLADAIAQVIEESNVVARRVIASQERQSGKQIFETIKTSEDPKVVKFREFKEQLLAKLEAAEKATEEYVKAELLGAAETISDEEMETLRQQHRDAKAKVKAATDLAKMQPDYTPAWEESLPAMLTFRKGGSVGAATGIKRPRLDSAQINGENFSVTKRNAKTGEVTEGVTFTAIALELVKREKANGSDVKVTSADLVAAAAATDANWQSSNSVEFVWAGSANYTITVFPKQTETE